MNFRLKHSLNLCLVAGALLLAACGKKENKVSSTVSGSTPFYSGNSAFNSSVGSSIINQVSSIKANVSCLNGGYRLTNDVSFYVQGGVVAANKIGGNWQSGFFSSGTVNKLWIGVSAARDIMFVTQVVSGTQVVGYNVTLSFCELKNAYSTFPSIISNERSLTNFAAPYGIILDSNTYCGYSVVDLAANTVIVSQAIAGNSYTSTATVPTSFTKPTCNGQF